MGEVYTPNRTELANLVINKQQPNLTKSLIIENPQLELDILRRFAAISGDTRVISIEDYSGNPQLAQSLLTQLQGLHLYWNDNCPWHESLVTFYDLESARLFLEEMRSRLGANAFANSKVVFEELLLGLDFRQIPEFKNITFAPNEPPHHVITRAYNVPQNGSYTINPSLSSLPRATRETLLNLQLYSNSNLLLGHVIAHPERELRLLQEIAASDGDIESISDIDMQSPVFQTKLKQLEGYSLYTNDQGQDATQADLNGAYALLDALAGRYNLASSDVLLTESIAPTSGRRTINGTQIILNEQAGNFVEIKNFVK